MTFIKINLSKPTLQNLRLLFAVKEKQIKII